MLPPEDDDNGNIEYKLKIKPNSKHRFQQLTTQLKWRLSEGNGKAEYYLGVYDDGTIGNISKETLKESIEYIKQICNEINSSIRNVETMEFIDNDKQIHNWYKVKMQNNIEKIKDYRIIFIGPSQSGKTTLISNLANDIIDNGNGSTRSMVFNHKHEIYSGITSSISIEKMEINRKNVKSVYHLIDTPGNKKYLKTTTRSILKYKPDLVFLCVNATKVNEKDIIFFKKLIDFYSLEFKVLLMKTDLVKTQQKLNKARSTIIQLLSNNEMQDNDASIIEIDNTHEDYENLLNVLKKVKSNHELTNDDMVIQTCKTIKIPNIGKIHIGLTTDKINIENDYYLSNSEIINKKIKIDSMYYLDRSIEKISGDKLLTFKLNDKLNIFNKSDIIISKAHIPVYSKLVVECEDEIKFNKGTCMYNNQYLTVVINKVKDGYELINTAFINVSDKLIIRQNNRNYYCKLISQA